MARLSRRSAGARWTFHFLRARNGDVLAGLTSSDAPRSACTAAAVHGIVLLQIPSNQDGTAHVASERKVAAMGARAANQAGYRPAKHPANSTTTAAVPRLSRRGTKKEKAAGSPGKLVRMLSRYRAVPKPRTRPMRVPDQREHCPLDQHLPHDGGPGNPDGPKGGDFSEALVDGDREQGADEKNGDDQTHGSEDVRQLAKVDQPLLEDVHEIGHAVHLEVGKLLREPGGQALGPPVSCLAFTRISDARSSRRP